MVEFVIRQVGADGAEWELRCGDELLNTWGVSPMAVARLMNEATMVAAERKLGAIRVRVVPQYGFSEIFVLSVAL